MMQQQVSMETALDVARERLGEKDWEITILRARLRELERNPAPVQDVAVGMPYAPGTADGVG
jgi:hypothetical protein